MGVDYYCRIRIVTVSHSWDDVYFQWSDNGQTGCSGEAAYIAHNRIKIRC